MTYEGQSEEQCLGETGRATMGQREQESCELLAPQQT